MSMKISSRPIKPRGKSTRSTTCIFLVAKIMRLIVYEVEMVVGREAGILESGNAYYRRYCQLMVVGASHDNTRFELLA